MEDLIISSVGALLGLQKGGPKKEGGEKKKRTSMIGE